MDITLCQPLNRKQSNADNKYKTPHVWPAQNQLNLPEENNALGNDWLQEVD